MIGSGVGLWMPQPAGQQGPVGETYYVRSGGSDAAAGTTAEPWLTIAHALTQIEAGDTLVIGGGTWPAATIGISGAAGRPITFLSETLHGAFFDVDAYAALIVTGKYLTFDGLRIRNYSRHGIEGQYNHHMTVQNCWVHGCGGNGIGSFGGDFYTIVANICEGNGRTGWNSGISVYEPDHWTTKDESTPGLARNVFRNNLLLRNRQLGFVNFDTGGTTAIAVGNAVNVGTGKVVGTVDRVEVTSGTWAGSNAAGRIGILVDNEPAAMADNDAIVIGGATRALVSGAHSPYTDEGMFTDGNGLILDDWGWYQRKFFVISFTSGGTTPLAYGNTVDVGTGGDTGTVSDVWLTSGSWAAGTAAGKVRIDFGSDTPGGVANGTQLLVGGVQRALTSGAWTQYGYPYGALVEGNIAAFNGGKGIQCYAVRGACLVRNNTAWHNNRDGNQIGQFYRGDITTQASIADVVTFVNNLAVCDPSVDANLHALGVYDGDASYAYNLTWDGDSSSVTTFSATATSLGGNVGAAPLLADPANDDFHPTASSPAVDAGTNTYGMPASDREGTTYVSGDVIIGALQSLGTAAAAGETLFGATLSPSSTVTDEDTPSWDAYLLGAALKFAVNGEVTHIRWYKHAGDSAATRAVGLWSSAGALLEKGSGSTGSVGWNDIALDAPVAVTAGTLYVASVLAPKPADYAVIAGLGDADTTNGNITAPDNTEAGGQGRFSQGGVASPDWVFPSSSFGNNGYGVDVVFMAGPVLSSTADAANGHNAATGSVSTDTGNGTLYWVVLLTADSAPSPAQVEAGTKADDSPAPASGSQAVGATGSQTLSPAPSGLTAGTGYKIAYMHKSAGGVRSAVAVADGFTTTALTAPTVVAIGTLQGGINSATYDLTAAGLTGAQNDDVLVAWIETANEAPGATPANYAFLGSPPGIGTPADVAAVALNTAWWRVNGTPANPNFGDAGDHTIMRMILVRGCKTTGVPIVMLSADAASHVDTDALPAATTTVDKCLVVHAAAHGQDLGADFVVAWSSPNLTGGTALFEVGSTLGNGGGIAAYAGVKDVAGSLGTVTVDMQNITQPQNIAWATFAFIPVGG